MIKHIYRTNFLSHEVRVPKEFFNIKAQAIAQGIKALADDEGSVLSYKIRICSSNKLFLEDVQKLIQEKFSELSKHAVVQRGGKKAYNLVIRSGGIKPFAKLIGFMHAQKNTDLKLLLDMKSRCTKKMSRVSTKMMILRNLEDGGKTAKELMRRMKMDSEMIRRHIVGYKSNRTHILGLQERGLVEGEESSKGCVWQLTSKGRNSCDIR